MIEDSEVKILTDDRELGLFLASTMSRQEVKSNNLGDFLSKGPACSNKWKEPRRSPTEEEGK